MKAAFANVDGVRIRYLYEGTGPALLMIQPIGHSSDVFLRNIDELAESFTVIAPDLPGHGFSDAISFDGTSPQMATARLFGSLCRQMGLERYCVLGSSYGGLIAALMWFERPQAVAGLVIVGSGSVFQSAEQQETVLRAVYENASQAMANPTLVSCRQRIANICYSAASVAEEMLLVQLTYYALPDRFDAYRNTLEGVIRSLRLPEHNVSTRLQHLAVPTLVLTGREDIRARWQVLEQGTKEMPDARFVVIEQCGHLPYMEHPQAFNRHVTEFLKSTLPAATEIWCRSRSTPSESRKSP